ncbi:SPOR domain-containing protein [Mesorhizobium delmotii]|uniref:Sporulation domain protein n=1 Tax=Mesorhizobium delmotii TaxID=1631247 RepID=A0A2P9ASD2_9HYPH|nr:SPOR domain-containing protein [Mesorhizobium delmotii]SJM34065.1 Sporulation domain protein [Mesorhizobium delmotii]
MADRTQLRAAAQNDIADDDPFAELTRIMGFDPRQPVKPQAQPKAAPASQPADDGDFDIDLEKELMGEFGADDNDGATEIREPAFEAAATDAMDDGLGDDELAASLEQDFLLDADAADEAVHAVAADDARAGVAEATAPAVEAAFDDDFDDALASSLEDVSPFEDDLPVNEKLGNDELAASLEQDFLLDDDATDETAYAVAADDVRSDVAEASAPAAEAAFDDDFNDGLASSLEDVSPFEDDLPVDDELAASLEQDLLLDDDAMDEAEQNTATVSALAAEPAFDDEFDDAVASSLEDELMLDEHVPMAHAVAAEPAEISAPAAQPVFDDEFDNAVASSLEDELILDEHVPMEQAAVEAPAAPDRAVSEASGEDFVGHYDAMADVDMDFEVRTAEPVEIDEPEIDEPEAIAAKDGPSAATPEDAFDADFDLSLDEALAEEAEEPVAQASGVAAQPTAPAAVVQPAAPAPVADERSLEDELNALLGTMRTRAAPVAASAANEPAMVQQPVAAAGKAADKPVDTIDELDWSLDEQDLSEPSDGAVEAAEADLDSVLLDELESQDFGAEDAARPADVDFDDDALHTAFAKDIGLDHGDGENVAAAASQDDALNWMAARSAPPAPAHSWSRVTPVAQSQPSFAAQPTASARTTEVASGKATEAPPPMAAVPSYQDEPAQNDAANAASAPAQSEQSSSYDEMPDVETVDVPERVVALADDLDIPELDFNDDEPAAPAYDDLDTEFASLLTEMNTVDVAAAPARSASYDDETYNAGFQSGAGIQSAAGFQSAYEPERVETRTYAARPAQASVSASYADAASGFDWGDLPNGRPASQADDFGLDELDYDPELDEAMSVPGLAGHDAARPRSRGLLVAAVVGAVALAGGLGAFALSFGGAGGADAPVIVKADNAPIKVRPENPGGTVVPNQDNKVYDAVAKGGPKPAEPVQEKLVTNTEEPVNVAAKEPPQSRVVDLSPDDIDTAEAADAIRNAESAAAEGANAIRGTQAAGNADVAAAPAPKSEDRIAQVLQEADQGIEPDVVAVAPRKVRTMVVKSDGSLVAREDPAPAAPQTAAVEPVDPAPAPQMAAVEPVDPAPQHVAPAGQADDAAEQTGTVPPVADQASGDLLGGDPVGGDQTEIAKPETAKPETVDPTTAPAAAPEAEAQTAQPANTPATVPVAPQRPSDQPVDVVGEVKPDQVASISPAAASTSGGSWSMQIASQPTVESAQSTYQDLQRRYGSVLSGHTANIVKAEIAGKGTFYRVRVPAKSRNDAINLCTNYKAAGGNCFVSR